jgi:hypothetical protein
VLQIRPTSVESDLVRRPAFEWSQEAGPIRSLAAILVLAGVVLLAVLPAAIALRAVDLPAGWVATAFEALGLVVIGVKLIAMSWAVGVRLFGARTLGPAIVSAD